MKLKQWRRKNYGWRRLICVATIISNGFYRTYFGKLPTQFRRRVYILRPISIFFLDVFIGSQQLLAADRDLANTNHMNTLMIRAWLIVIVVFMKKHLSVVRGY